MQSNLVSGHGHEKTTNSGVGTALLAALAVAVFAVVSMRTQEASAVTDPRQEPPLVRLVTAARPTNSERRFTGVIAARVQSNLGFRVPGKIIRRLVDVGQQVKAGQALMQIDESDLRLAVTAKRNAVIAARAVAIKRAPMKSAMPRLFKPPQCQCSATSRPRPRLIRPRRSWPRQKPRRASQKTKQPIRPLLRMPMARWSRPWVNRARSWPRGKLWCGLPMPGRVRLLFSFPKRCGRKSVRWPRRASTATVSGARPHGCDNCQTPPIPRRGPSKPATSLTEKPRPHPLARR